MFNLLRYAQKCNFVNTFLRSNTCKSSPIRRCFSNKSLDININVAKDVILYKHKNDNFFRVINIFAICQFGFWTYLAMFGYTNLKNTPVNENEDKWWRKLNLGDKKYRNTFTTISFLIGWGIITVTWMYSLKSVKYLILRKGGKEISIVTYTPTGSNRILTLPLNKLNCKDSRTSAKSQLPIEVQGHYLHYILDMRGEFTNPDLFDHTAGLKRKWT